MSNCIFPAGPVPGTGQPGSYDTREFKEGEPVCINMTYTDPPSIEEGTYDKPVQQRGTGNIYGHNITRSDGNIIGVHWLNVGKMVHPVSKTAANVVAANKGLPQYVLHGYGGKRRTRISKKRRQLRRRRHRRSTRKN